MAQGSLLTSQGTPDGNYRIYVRDSFTYHGDIALPASRVLVGYFGVFTAKVGNVFRGTLVAPRGRINVVPEAHFGRFFGRAVEIHQGAWIERQEPFCP